MSDDDRVRDRTIGVWWIGAEPPPERALAQVRTHLGRVFGLPVRALHGRERPPDVLDPARHQASSTRILEWLAVAGPRGAGKLLAITDMDLFIPALTFVFGEAQLGGRAAVVSTARLVPAGRTLGTGGPLFASRLAKEAVHELGHAFGLVHCDDARCVMSRSTSLIEVDTKSGALCESCWTRYLDLRDAWGTP